MKSKTKKKMVEAGAGVVTAAALAAAGAYYLSTEAGKKQTAKAKAWAAKARKEIEKEVRAAKNMNAGDYQRIVDGAMKRYAQGMAMMKAASQGKKSPRKGAVRKASRGQKASAKKAPAKKSAARRASKKHPR